MSPQLPDSMHWQIYLDELCEAVAHKRGLRVSRPTMSRLLRRLDLGRKKSRSTPPKERLRESAGSVTGTEE